MLLASTSQDARIRLWRFERAVPDTLRPEEVWGGVGVAGAPILCPQGACNTQVFFFKTGPLFGCDWQAGILLPLKWGSILGHHPPPYELGQRANVQ